MTKISYIRGVKSRQFMEPNPGRLDLMEFERPTDPDVMPPEKAANGLTWSIIGITFIYLLLNR